MLAQLQVGVKAFAKYGCLLVVISAFGIASSGDYGVQVYDTAVTLDGVVRCLMPAAPLLPHAVFSSSPSAPQPLTTVAIRLLLTPGVHIASPAAPVLFIALKARHPHGAHPEVRSTASPRRAPSSQFSLKHTPLLLILPFLFPLISNVSMSRLSTSSFHFSCILTKARIERENLSQLPPNESPTDKAPRFLAEIWCFMNEWALYSHASIIQATGTK